MPTNPLFARFFFVAWLLLGLAGCAREKGARSPAEAGVVAREIPLVFYLLSGPGEPNAADVEDLWSAVNLANQVYADARLSVYIHAIERFPVRYLHRSDDGDERLPWSVVAPDAIAMAPSMASAGFDDSHAAHRALWLGQVAARLPPDGITVFIVPFSGHNGKMWGSNCAAPFPHNDGDPYYDPGPGAAWLRDGSKGIFCTPTARAGHRIDALAHELGHYIGGLNHTWDVTNATANRKEGVVAEDYFDLLYATTPGGIARFQSREQALQARGYTVPLDSNCPDCVVSSSRRVLPSTACITAFRLVSPLGVLELNSAEHPALLDGVAFPPRQGDPRYGVNVMSYLYQNPEATPCALRLSRAQIALLHSKLRSPVGHRNLLGTVQRSRLPPPAPALVSGS